MKSLVIPADRTLPFRVANLDSLEKMQEAVGGYIERVLLPRSASALVDFYVNEEANLPPVPKPHNERATVLMHRLYLAAGHKLRLVVLKGDVFICGPADAEGNLTDVPQSVLDAMENTEPRTALEGILKRRGM